MSMIVKIPTFSQEFIQEVYDITVQDDQYVFFAVRRAFDDDWFIYTTQDGVCPNWFNFSYTIDDRLIYSEVLNSEWEDSVYWHDAN